MNLAKSGTLMAFVATARPDAARAFYADVLGLELRSDDQFALVFDANGTTLRVAKVQQLAPAPFTVLGWVVDDIAAAIDALAGSGVRFERFAGMAQDERGIWTVEGGKVAWFKDPDGNLLSLSQSI
jgi:catechol 2,3-dioxygenase-like lactoylglutathione lyase family enzyme